MTLGIGSDRLHKNFNRPPFPYERLAVSLMTTLRIVLASDSHLSSRTRVFESNWTAVRRFAASAGADVTVHLGDVSLDGATDPADLLYSHARCQDWPTPIRFLPGNHDVGDNPHGPGIPNEHPLSAQRLVAYRALFGLDYWSMEVDGWWIIGLDAQLFGSDTPEEAEQWTWLRACVAQVRDRPVALLLHKPLFQKSADDALPHIRYVPLGPRRRLLDLVAPLDLRVVASGHTHQYLERTIDGVRHVWVPSSAFVFPDSMQERIGEKLTAIGLLDLSPEGWRFDLVCADGMEQHDLIDYPMFRPTIERNSHQIVTSSSQ